jgi:hypothetical protein
VFVFEILIFFLIAQYMQGKLKDPRAIFGISARLRLQFADTLRQRLQELWRTLMSTNSCSDAASGASLWNNTEVA